MHRRARLLQAGSILAVALFGAAPAASADAPIEASVITSNTPVVRWSCSAAVDAPLCRASSVFRMGRVGGAGVATTRTSNSSGRARSALEPGRWFWQVFSGGCHDSGCRLRRHEFTIRGNATRIGLSSRLVTRTTLVFSAPFSANARRATTTLQLIQDDRAFFTGRTTSTAAGVPNRRTASFRWTNDDVSHGTEVTARVTVLVGGRRFARSVTLLAPGRS